MFIGYICDGMKTINKIGLLRGTDCKSAPAGVSSDIFVFGNVGVGGMIVGSPFTKSSHKLQLKGSALEEAAYMELGDGSDKDWRCLKFWIKGDSADYQFWIDNDVAFKFNTAFMTVGKRERPMNIRVNGKIDANEVEVSLNHWYDHVFHEGYNLMPLSELELFVSTNKHLPEIPSEKEVIENGINVGEMNALLLKKIEELTLYVIDLKKENNEIKAKLTSLIK